MGRAVHCELCGEKGAGASPKGFIACSEHWEADQLVTYDWLDGGLLPFDQAEARTRHRRGPA
jgi:hypothetical protein